MKDEFFQETFHTALEAIKKDCQKPSGLIYYRVSVYLSLM